MPSFKFLQNIAKRKEQAEADEQGKYVALLKRAALIDDLSVEDEITLTDLHGRYGVGELASVAEEIKEHANLQSVAEQLPALQKAVAESEKREASKKADFEREKVTAEKKLAEMLASHKVESAKMFDATQGAKAKRDAAIEAVDRRGGLEQKHWKFFGVADPKANTNGDTNTASPATRPLTVALQERISRTADVIFEHVLDGTVKPQVYRGRQFILSDGQDNDEFESMVDILGRIARLEIKPSQVRFLRNGMTDTAGILSDYIRDKLLLDVAELVRDIRHGMDDANYVYALLPSQLPERLADMVATTERAREEAAREAAAGANSV